jgi:hypothetical protein
MFVQVCLLNNKTHEPPLMEMLIIYGECGNEVNPHALFSRAFQQRFYTNLWVVLLGNRVVCLQ